MTGCKSESTKQTETEQVKRSSAPPFTKEIFSDLLAKEQKKEKYPKEVYKLSGKVVRIETVQTDSHTDLKLVLRLWPDSEIDAICEFDSRSLSFVKKRKIGETVHLKALLSFVSENSVFVVGTTAEQQSTSTDP
jgi:predicted nucleotidyltransferase